MSTPNLALAHIASNQASKEITANAALDGLDRALTGLLAKAFPSDADYTLNLSAVPSEATGYIAYNFTGTITALRNIIVPTGKKMYLVQNSTTGGLPIKVKTAAGTGVIVANGAGYALLYCDGTNVVALAQSTGLGAAVVMADLMPGADWGAKVQAADTLLGANAGEIWVTPAAGLSAPAADITLNSMHTLRFIGGGWSQPQVWMLGTSRILIPQGAFAVGISGSKGQQAWIQYSGTGYAVVIGAVGSTQTTHITIEDLGIGLRSTVDNAGCIHAICTEFLQINRCFLDGNSLYKQYGILSDGASGSGGFSAFTSITNCEINLCYYGIKFTAGSGSAHVFGGYLGGVGSGVAGAFGIDIDSVGGGNCINVFCCDMEGWATALRIATGQNVLSGVRFESNATDILFDTGSSANKVTTFNASGLVVVNSGAATNQVLYSNQNLALAATTVNGHPLSANVVVSASDLTTGTLPHAQLPALVSGDIPAIAESQVTSLVSDLALKAPLASPALTGTATAVTLKVSKAITAGLNAMGNVSGAALSIDLSLGNVITMTLIGNVTSSAFANAVAAFGQDVTLIITQDGTGGRTFAWPSAVVPVGIAPVPSLAPNSVSVFKATIDGSGNANFTANGPVTVFRQKASGIVASSSGSPTFTPPVAGNYRANVLIRCTTVGTTATMGLKISTNSGGVNSQGAPTNVPCTAVGLQSGISFPFYDDSLSAAHAVSWFNTLTNAIGAAVYAVEFWIEYLGN